MRSIRWTLACLSLILLSSGFSSAQAGDVVRFDRFGDINCEDEMARLDNFAVQMQSNSGSVGYIIVYAGRQARRGEAQARAARLRAYLVESRGLDVNRIMTIDGGYMEHLTVDLWIMPGGMGAPAPAPTVNPRNVRFKRGKIKRSEYQRCDP